MGVLIFLNIAITGFDLTTKDGYDDMWEQFDSIIGWKFLKAMHLNDSKGTGYPITSILLILTSIKNPIMLYKTPSLCQS